MTIAIFGIIMENFPNICSCLFAFNIILRLARNCHIKQIFENFSICLYPLTITRSRRLPPPFFLIGLSRLTPTLLFHSPPLFFSEPPLPTATLPILPILFVPYRRSPSFRGKYTLLSAYARFNLKKVFVIYVQKRKFVVE